MILTTSVQTEASFSHIGQVARGQPRRLREAGLPGARQSHVFVVRHEAPGLGGSVAAEWLGVSRARIGQILHARCYRHGHGDGHECVSIDVVATKGGRAACFPAEHVGSQA